MPLLDNAIGKPVQAKTSHKEAPKCSQPKFQLVQALRTDYGAVLDWSPTTINQTLDGNILLSNKEKLYVYQQHTSNPIRSIPLKKNIKIQDVACADGFIYVACTGSQGSGEVHQYKESNGAFVKWFPVGYSGDSYNHIHMACVGDLVYLLSSEDRKVFRFSRIIQEGGLATIETFLSQDNCSKMRNPGFMAANEKLIVVGNGYGSASEYLIFDTRGKLLYTKCCQKYMIKLDEPSNVMFDLKGNIVIVDKYYEEICILSDKGKLIGQIDIKCTKWKGSHPELVALMFTREDQLVSIFHKTSKTENFNAIVYYDYKFCLKQI